MTVPLKLLMAARLMMSSASRINLKVESRLVPHPMVHNVPMIGTHASLPRLLMQFDSNSVGKRREIGLCEILEHEKATMWLCDKEDGQEVCRETQRMFLRTEPSPEMTCVLQEGLFMEGKPVWACAELPTTILADEYGSPAESTDEGSKQGGPAESTDAESERGGPAEPAEDDAEATRDSELEDREASATRDSEPEAAGNQGRSNASTQSPVKTAGLRNMEPGFTKGDSAGWWQGSK